MRRLRKLYSSILCLLVMGLIHGGVSRQHLAGSECRTPKFENGVCTLLEDCRILMSILLREKSNHESMNLLRRSICGFQDMNPIVCCPEDRIVDTIQNKFAGSGDECGIVDNYDVELGPDGWPWAVRLGFNSSSSPEVQWLCEGAIISNKYVITSALCTTHPTLTLSVIRVGWHKLRAPGRQSYKDYQPKEVILHTNYSEQTKQNNLALIHLQENIQFDTQIRPICLPKEPRVKKPDLFKSHLRAGWVADIYVNYQDSTVNLYDDNECTKSSKTRQPISENEICAKVLLGDLEVQKVGLLMLPNHGLRYSLVGILSSSPNMESEGTLKVYTLISDYVDWILKHIDLKSGQEI